MTSKAPKKPTRAQNIRNKIVLPHLKVTTLSKPKTSLTNLKDYLILDLLGDFKK